MTITTGRNLSERLLTTALVGNRYTFQELFDRVNMLSQEQVCMDWADETQYTDEQDYAINFDSDTGFGTIFYLKTRTDKLFITEVSFEVDTL